MLRCKAGAANQMPQVKLMSVIQLAELMANPGLVRCMAPHPQQL
jgi:hypothetical protein